MANKNTKELFIKAHNGDLKAREQLILQNQLMVYKICDKYRNTNDYENLVQVGTIGLIKAVDKFEIERGLQFSTYAYVTINGEIARYYRDYREDRPFKPGRREYTLYKKICEARKILTQEFGGEPKSHEIAIYLGENIKEVECLINALENSQSIYKVKHRNEKNERDILIIDSILDESISEQQVINKIMIEKALRVLTDKQRKVIHLRYFKEYSQAKVGQVLNISQVQISRIERKALELMREVI